MMTFEKFQATILNELPNRSCRLQFKDFLSDSRTENRNILPAYQFQDADPGYYGHLERDGTWVVCFNGAKGTGATFQQADHAMQKDYRNIA